MELQRIRKVAKSIGPKLFIDKFHFNKVISHLDRHDYKLNSKILKFINLDLSKKWFNFTLMSLIADNQQGEIKKWQIKLIRYVANNYKNYIVSKNSGE